MATEENNKSRIDSLNQRLYTPDESKLRKMKEGGFTPMQSSAPEAWTQPVSRRPIVAPIHTHSSLYKKIFLLSIGFFILAAAVAAFSFLRDDNTISSGNIDIQIVGNSFTPGGEELPLQIEITNHNSVALDSTDIVIEYPKGSPDDPASEIMRITEDIGNIGANKKVTKTENLVLFGEQGEVKNIKFTLEYRIAGQSAVFLKETAYAVTISSAPVALSVDAPEKTSSNQEITLKIKAALNSSEASPQMVLKVDYPTGFKFISSEPKPVFGNTVWSLANLETGKPAEVIIKGTLTGEDNEERSFRVSTGLSDALDQSRITTPFNSMVKVITIEKPFIEATLSINGSTDEEYITTSNAPLRGTIRWANNLPTRVTDLEIRAKFSGSAWNESAVTAQSGFYNSQTDEIIWDKNTVSNFVSVDPGDTGEVNFNFASLPLVSGSSSILSDPRIKIDISIRGKQPTEGNTVKQVDNFESKVVKISSDVQLAVEGLYHAGPFTNTGPLPPVPEQKTSYTVHMTATNSSNTVVNTKVVTTLPIWVKFAGPTSPAGETVEYNTSTREVTWTIGEIKKTTGYTSSPREAYFQVELNPSTSQSGSVLPLTNEFTLTATDQFTSSNIRVTRGKVTTNLPNDPGFPSGGGVVAH